MNPLTALSILDGRNLKQVEELSGYFSELVFMQYRIRVEVEYLLFLSRETEIVRKFTQSEKEILDALWKNFSLQSGETVKEFEKTTNHDLKALEYFMRDTLEKTSLKNVASFIHFGLTSYDVTTCAYGLMLKEAREKVFKPEIDVLLTLLRSLITDCKNMTMLARTHGQPAVPTTMGKELAVFYQRIQNELQVLETSAIEGKLTGAVGNFNALSFVYPDYDWLSKSREFVSSLGLTPNTVTTQILPYDSWLRLFDSYKRLNNILVDFVQDIWWYISFDYFTQVKKEGEVGSSTMSHKINPILFENAEGNLQIANSLFEFFVRKLSVSRLQRDLSDSTVKRDFGVAFGFTLLAFKSITSGLGRISPNREKMAADLDSHWEVFSEGIQTFLRSQGNNEAFELLKEKTRGKTLNKKELHKIIDELSLNSEEKKKLKINSLKEYQGLAVEIVEKVVVTEVA